MTEERTPYMGQSANVARWGKSSLIALFSFEASGADRQELRKDVVFVLNEMVDGPALGFPGYMIERIVQVQVMEPAQPSGIQKWRCDVYALCEIAPEPAAPGQRLATAWMQTEGGETLEVAAGAGHGSLQGKFR